MSEVAFDQFEEAANIQLVSAISLSKASQGFSFSADQLKRSLVSVMVGFEAVVDGLRQAVNAIQRFAIQVAGAGVFVDNFDPTGFNNVKRIVGVGLSQITDQASQPALSEKRGPFNGTIFEGNFPNIKEDLLKISGLKQGVETNKFMTDTFPGSKITSKITAREGLKGLLDTFIAPLKGMVSGIGTGAASGGVTGAIGGGLGGLIGGVGKAMAPFGSIAKGMGKSLGAGLASLGPQMLALELVMKPISALLQGLMEPLEPIIDLFGSVGEIIGMLLIPIVTELMKILMPFLPLLIEIVMALMPVIRILIIPLTILGQIMTVMVPWITELVKFIGGLTSVLDVFTNIVVGIPAIFMSGIDAIISPLFTAIGDAGDNIKGFFDSISSFITGVVDSIVNFFNGIKDFFLGIVNDIRDWGEGVVDTIRGWFDGIVTDIQDFFDDINIFKRN